MSVGQAFHQAEQLRALAGADVPRYQVEAGMALQAQSRWIVQPVLETIAVLVPGDKPVYYTNGEVVDPATGITVRVDEIFR